MKKYFKILFTNKRIMLSLAICLYVLIGTIRAMFIGYSDEYALTYVYGYWVSIFILIPLAGVIGLLYLVYQKSKI